MAEKSLFYDRLGSRLTRRSVKHILLRHMNLMNLYYLEDVFRRHKDNGRIFESLEEALEDPVYQIHDLYVGDKGVSRLERIAPASTPVLSTSRWAEQRVADIKPKLLSGSIVYYKTPT